MREIVVYGQAFDAPAVGQAVKHEVHAPHLIDAAGHRERHALTGCSPHLLMLTNRQLRLAVQPINTLVVQARQMRAQQVMDVATAEAPQHLRGLDDVGDELLRGLSFMDFTAFTLVR